VQLSGPSIWPLLAAVVLTLNFVATLFDVYWLLALSVVGTVGTTIGWLWPSKADRERRLDEEGADGRLHGLPVYTSGTSAPAWWTMAHIVLVVAVATACLVVSYYYLEAGATAWPPVGYPLPEFQLAGAATVCLGAGALAAWWAERRIRRGGQSQLRLGLAAAAAAGAASLALLIADVVRMAGSGVSASAHAYGSAAHTLLGYQALLVVAGLVILGVVLAQALLGYFDSRRFLAVQNTAMFLSAVAVNWLVIFGVVYVSPYVL
jgi:heme/copper-type cytochrome/quinol oxidase subunit 3